MGTCYRLYKPDKGEYYDLGKGMYWSEIFEFHKQFIINELYPTAIDLQEFINEYFNTPNSDWTNEYSEYVSKNIFEWSKNDRLFFTTEYEDFKFEPKLVLNFIPDAKFLIGEYVETGERYYDSC